MKAVMGDVKTTYRASSQTSTVYTENSSKFSTFSPLIVHISNLLHKNDARTIQKS